MKRPNRKKPNMLAIYGVAVLVDITTVVIVIGLVITLIQWASR